jgi:hypothetical protein
MTEDEKAIWAATYAVEYNRWTCGDEREISATSRHEVKAARIALSQAAMAVVAARAALGEIKFDSPYLVPLFARQMVSAPKPKKKRRG